MGIIGKSSDELLVRFPLITLGLVLLGCSPILVSMIGSLISEAITGEACKGDCIWAGLGYLFMLTMPLAILLFLILILLLIIDVISLNRKK